jgi:hypothetical protein
MHRGGDRVAPAGHPFVVFSGSGEDLPDQVREVIGGAPIIDKPASLESIFEALAKL